MPPVKIGNIHSAILAFRYFLLARKNIMDSDVYEVPCQIGFGISVRFDYSETSISYVLEHEKYSHIKLKLPIYFAENVAEELLQWKERMDKKSVMDSIRDFYERKWYICNCGQPSCFFGKDDRCQRCFLLWYKRKDDRCCICLDNSGVWTKLPCDHILHTTCLTKLHENREYECPLCRTSYLCRVKELVHGWPYFETADDCAGFSKTFK